ncbi:MAG: ABC transporter permease [Gemmataceae bacterium]|nr:ABC transporter permease [Gemmataceae bacterium]
MLGPIFNREWMILPRRPRHFPTRAAYLGVLWVIAVTTWLSTGMWQRQATLGETARLGPLLFQILCVVQLTFLLFFSALSAASAVSLEKDRRTFILLLITDLRDREIVVGKMLGSLLPIVFLLAGAAPVLASLLLLGGVAPFQVIQALVVLTATALVAGSLGGLIALWREKTFQSLALTVLVLVLHLTLVRAIGFIPGLDPATARFCQERLDPFLALDSVLDPLASTAAGMAPAYVFGLIMVLIAGGLNGWGMFKLRVWNPSGEPIMQRETPQESTVVELDRAVAHAAPGQARNVRGNPILWREIFTRAYGRKPLLIKLAYAVVLALICFAALKPLFNLEERVPFFAAYGLLPVSVLSLLLVAAQAATSITSERDTGALDLLLVTDLSPQEFIFGKLGGIVWNTKEYLIPPLLLAGVYAWFGALATPPANQLQLSASMNLTSFLCVAAGLLLLQGFAMVLGVHVALRNQNSRLAVINTLGTIFFLTAGTLITISLILINGRFEYQWASFVFFLAAGIGGLWWVLNGERPSPALTLASWLCPLSVFYGIANVLVAKPGSQETADPLLSFLVLGGAFGFTLAAMLVPLLSEFDVALGRTTGGAD